MMKIRAQGANRWKRPLWARLVIGSSLGRSGPVRRHRRVLEAVGSVGHSFVAWAVES
jgi:hypothetical protein